jgi:heme/copper-type cytochrome/quinol oxidase subunit 4
MENQKQSIKSLILLYGIILAVITILISVVKYAMGNHLERNVWESVFGIALMIALTVYPIMLFKKGNNGFLNLSQSIKIGLGVAAVSGIISILYFFVFANFIEPEFAKQVMDAQMTEAIKQNPEISSADLEKGREMGQKFVMPMLYGGIIVVNLFLGFIISLIAGLAMKKE